MHQNSLTLRDSTVVCGPGVTNISRHMAHTEEIVHKLLTGSCTIQDGRVIMRPGWWGGGRLGNLVQGIGAALIFSRYVGATTIEITPPPTERLGNAIAIPEKLVLDGARNDNLAENCVRAKEHYQAGAQSDGSSWGEIEEDYIFFTCSLVEASLYHDLLLQYVRPMLTCSENIETSTGADVLTVHLRSDDQTDLSAPCALIEKILEQSQHKNVLIVTSPTGSHPCLEVAKTFVAEGRNVSVQSGSLAEDFCSLVRAEALLLSFSTFSESAALLSKHVKNVYKGGDRFEPWWPGPQRVRWCIQSTGSGESYLWQGTQLNQYNVTDYQQKVGGWPWNAEANYICKNYPKEQIGDISTEECD